MGLAFFSASMRGEETKVSQICVAFLSIPMMAEMGAETASSHLPITGRVAVSRMRRRSSRPLEFAPSTLMQGGPRRWNDLFIQ